MTTSRIPPTSIETAPEATRPILQELKKAIGMVPNLYATIGHSPVALQGVLAFGKTLGGGKLSGRELELISLHVAQLNGCGYCVSAHTALAARAGIAAEEALAARAGQGHSAREAAILSLARRVVRTGGAGAGTEVALAREAGLTDGELIEVLAQVALNAFTNAVGIVAGLAIDFPAAPRLPQG